MGAGAGAGAGCKRQVHLLGRKASFAVLTTHTVHVCSCWQARPIYAYDMHASIACATQLQFMGLDLLAVELPLPNSTLASAWPIVVLRETALWQRELRMTGMHAWTRRLLPVYLFACGDLLTRTRISSNVMAIFLLWVLSSRRHAFTRQPAQ